MQSNQPVANPVAPTPRDRARQLCLAEARKSWHAALVAIDNADREPNLWHSWHAIERNMLLAQLHLRCARILTDLPQRHTNVGGPPTRD